MKLSFIFELLLIFILIAFAASAVIDSRRISTNKKTLNGRKQGKITHKRQQDSSANKYCSCSTKLCNCCREFNIPVVPLQGPGCASLQYLKGDRLAISMSFGERVLSNTTISSKKPQPVCMPLPGGVSKFCGRVYNIGRKGEDFNACLGLELRALEGVEAALRVSCFRFGPNGLRVTPSQPLPVVENEDDDDDDDDDEDNEDEDEDDFDFDDDEDDDEEDDDEDNDVDSVDYGTFSVFDDDFIGEYFAGQSSSGGSSGNQHKKKPTQPSTTRAPLRKVTKKPVALPPKVNLRLPVKPTKNKLKIKPTTPKTVLKTTPKKITTRTTTTTTTTTTTVAPEIETIPPPEIVNKVSVPSLIKNQTLDVPVETMTIQTTVQEKPVEAVLIPAPVSVISALVDTPVPTATQTTQPDKSNIIIVTSQPQESFITESATTTIQEKLETTTGNANETEITEHTVEETTSTTPTNNDDDEAEDESEEDALADVVEEVIDDEIEETSETVANDKDIATTTALPVKDKEPKDVLDDIVDGVVDTLSGDDESSEVANDKTDDDEEDDDEEDDDDDDDDLARNVRVRPDVRRFRGRQSRDMWLDRLHW